MANHYIMETIDIPNQIQLNDNIFYNCTECSSSIEIISINNNIIEFKCMNNHKIKLLIDEYIKKMKEYNSKNINDDMCIKHKKKYKIYCMECNIHLCIECLKSRNHINHNKINIVEIQPNNNEIKIINDMIIFYNKKIEIFENKKLSLKNELDKKIDGYKKKLNKYNELKIKEYENKMKNELKLNHDNYISDINNLIDKCKKEIKSKKFKYEKKILEIYNKYKLMKEKINIIYKKKIEHLDSIYNTITQKYGFNKKIENISNIKRLNEIIYNTYNIYKNNYYNCININKILFNYYNQNKNKNNMIIKELNKEYENIIKIENKNNIIMYNTIKELENKNEKLKKEINNIKIKYENLLNEYNKYKETNKEIIKQYDFGYYEGQIKNNKREGKGIFYWNVGDRYKGQWKNDLKEGKGIYYYNNGDRYEGDWKNDLKEGKGIYYWKNGEIYEGDWKNNLKEGLGIHHYKNEDKEMGYYYNNRKIGKHVTLTIKGEVKNNNYN